jgi:D-3-phosphoglycerate dehydrogenase
MKVLITPRSYGREDPDVFRVLKEAGLEVVTNDTGGILSKAQMMEAIAGCEGVIIGIDPLDADVIRAAPRLRAIAKYGVGMDNIDLKEAQKRGIRVSKTTGRTPRPSPITLWR